MNPLTNVKNIKKLSEAELKLGIAEKNSWHNMYKDSAWIFIGGLNFELCEGDIICVFSQYGEVVNINLIRDKKTGKSKGYCFLCYEDQRSTNLAVDNLNGIKLTGRIIRVDHVADYKPPKDDPHIDEEIRHVRKEGCAPPQLIQNIKKEKEDGSRRRDRDSDERSKEREERRLKEKARRHEDHSHRKKHNRRSRSRSKSPRRSEKYTKHKHN
ncbi:RNA-binding motif protein: X-linked 2-like protein [Leptotrombidium deliense]|uniref:RNA-binding motif protein, X-linked 2 n=1 Tax=Leptotrombidium deliense TaxID=299467 RepID=A0A443S209_9ACAR|nr:RNA-binding motif protein: X-linked 2-like protein [Leptotrombidium deliense]